MSSSDCDRIVIARALVEAAKRDAEAHEVAESIRRQLGLALEFLYEIDEERVAQ